MLVVALAGAHPALAWALVEVVARLEVVGARVGVAAVAVAELHSFGTSAVAVRMRMGLDVEYDSPEEQRPELPTLPEDAGCPDSSSAVALMHIRSAGGPRSLKKPARGFC